MPMPMPKPATVLARDRCAVCDAALPRHAGAAAGEPYPVCQAVSCRMVLSRRGAMGEAGFRQFLQLHAWQVRQRAAALREAQARAAAEQKENADAWDGLQESVAGVAALRLLLPSGPHQDSPVSADRLARYRAHLEQAAAEASRMASVPAPEESDQASVPDLPGQLCGQCGGGCCTRGGEQAYLGAPTLRRFMDAHPATSADDVVAAYLARVPASAQAGSCINHTGAGCSLPREMRSDTCNAFACSALACLLASRHDEAPVQAVLVVRRRQDHWHRFDAGPANDIIARTVLHQPSGDDAGSGT